MMKHQTVTLPAGESEVAIRLPKGVPAGIRSILSQSPVITGESVSAYEALLREFAGEVEPRDVFEWIWVKDLADLVWLSLRCRRVLKRHFDWQNREALPGQTLDEIFNPANRPGSLPGRSARVGPPVLDLDTIYDPAIHEKESRASESLGPTYAAWHLGPESLEEAFRQNANEIERAERFIAAYDRRRDALLREIEGRRADVGARLRRESDRIVDAEFTVSPGRSHETAA